MSDKMRRTDQNHAASELTGNLRQMIAVLQSERQALATLEADALFEVTQVKDTLCARIAGFDPQTIDEEARALAQTAKSLNEANRRVRNLLAANVAERLGTLGAQRHAYTNSHAAPYSGSPSA